MRKLTVLLLVLLYAVSLLGVSAFATNVDKAKVAGIDSRDIVPIKSKKLPLNDLAIERLNLPPGPSAPVVQGFLSSPGLVLGNTAYDMFHNSGSVRQIAVGSDGRIHFDWTHLAVGEALTLRAAYYCSYTAGGGLSTITNLADAMSKATSRFCALDVSGDLGLVAFHYGSAPQASSGLDFASGAASFAASDPAATVPVCEGTVSGSIFEPYIWPAVSGDVDGGTAIAHLVAIEGNTGADYGVIAYFRGVGPDLTYGTCGKFIDSTTEASFDVTQDPNSDRVVITYAKSREWGSRDNCDILYRMSPDLGLTWGAPVNITNYAPLNPERTFGETSALFDSRGYLHISFVGIYYDSAGGNATNQQSKLYHWSDSSNCISLILDANNYDQNCNMKSFERNVCRANLTECSTAGGKRIYATYTRYVGTTASPDCSAGSVPVGDIWASASSTSGLTWGPPVNMTNTATNGCAAGACDDDNFPSSARYVTDSLRLEYLNDKDAGSNIGGAGASTYSPVMFMSYPCFAMSSYIFLSATPASIIYPFHAKPNQQAIATVTLTNAGNLPATWTATDDAGWLTETASGGVGAGCTNTGTMTVTAGPIASPGLYHATITVNYNDGATFTIGVDFYVFDPFYLPVDVALKTATAKVGVGVTLNVNQTGRVASQDPTAGMTYATDLSHYLLYDGSLILGNSRDNLSWSLFTGGAGQPTTSNPYGYLYAIDSNYYRPDTCGSFRLAWGKGVNRDSTIGFKVEYIAPTSTDSSDFIIAHFRVYHGPNGVTPVSNLMIAFGADWDIPDDSSDNVSAADPTLNLIYQRGAHSGHNYDRLYGGLAYVADNGSAPVGAFSWDNDRYVYPKAGFQVDSVWNFADSVNGYHPSDSTEDLSTVFVAKRGITIGPADTVGFSFIIAGSHDQTAPKSLDGLKSAVTKAKKFIQNHIRQGGVQCAGPSCTSCGDADGNGIINISDVVAVIGFVFNSTPVPGDCMYTYGLADADGNMVVNISDVVALIGYVFNSTPVPHCNGM